MNILFEILIILVSLGVAIFVPTSLGLLIVSAFPKDPLKRKYLRALSWRFFWIPSAIFMIAFFIRVAIVAL